MSRTTLPIHPRTGLQAVGIVGGRPVWPIMGGAPKDGEDDADDTEDGDDDEDQDDDEDDVDWKVRALEQEREAAKWKRLSRKHEKRATTNADKAKKFDEGGDRRGGKDDGDQADVDAAVRKARDEERATARAEFGTKLVDAEIRARASTRMTDDQLDAVLDGLDRARFLEDDGEVDTDAVDDYITRLAPKRRNGEDGDGDEGTRKRGTARGGSGMGQGRGRKDDKSGGVAAGRARYEARRDAQKTTSS